MHHLWVCFSFSRWAQGICTPSKIPICTELPSAPDLFLNKTHNEREKMFNCITAVTFVRYIFGGYLCTCLLLKKYKDPLLSFKREERKKRENKIGRRTRSKPWTSVVSEEGLWLKDPLTLWRISDPKGSPEKDSFCPLTDQARKQPPIGAFWFWMLESTCFFQSSSKWNIFLCCLWNLWFWLLL